MIKVPHHKTRNINVAGPIAEQSKSSDLDRSWGDPGSNPGRGRIFLDGQKEAVH